MSFLDEARKQNSQKIVLYEYDIGVAVDNPVNFEPGIFIYQFAKSANATASDKWPRSYWFVNYDSSGFNNVKSLKVDNDNYVQVASLPLLRVQEKTFYFDKLSEKLYVHFENDSWYLDRIVRVGAISGVVDNIDFTTVNQAAYEDIIYDPHFLSLPTFSRKKDPLFFGRLGLLNFSVNLQNANGFYDDFTEKDVYGQRGQILLGFAGLDYSEYRPLITNFIEEPSWDFDSITIKNQDERELLTRKVPVRQYSLNDYGGLNEENDGKYKPLAYGPVRNAPTVCIDELFATTNATFHFMDTTDHPASSILKVHAYYQDNKSDVTASVINADLAAGTFQLPVSVCFDVDTLKEITVDFVGYSGNDGFDVITDLYNIYALTPFNSTNYDVSEWATEKLRSRGIGLYINEPSELGKIFTEIAVSLNALWFIKDNGLITQRVFYYDRIPRGIMEDWIDDPRFSKPVNEYLSSITVNYDKNYNASDSYRSYLNSSYEKEAVKKYKKYVTKNFKTLLTTKDDAIDFSETLLRRSSDVLETVVRSTKLQYIDYEIMDFVIASHNRQSESEVYSVYEIIGKTVNLDKMSIQWIMKKVSDYTIPVETSGNYFALSNYFAFDNYFGVTNYG